MNVPKEKFANYTTNRLVNLPGQTVSVRQILETLENVAGKSIRSLVVKEVDPTIEGMVGSWPPAFRTTKAQELGLHGDISLKEIVRTAAARLRKP